MHISLLLSLAVLTPGEVGEAGDVGARQDEVQEVCRELRPILPDLRRIDRWDDNGRGHLVSDARVVELERRLEEYLGLPPVLRVKLTTISGHRREVAKHGSITAWIHHRATGLGLGHARIAWDGESVDVGGLRFLETPAPRAFTSADLPAFYGRLGALLELVAPPAYPIEGMSFFSGSTSGADPGFRATVAIRVRGEAEGSGARGEKYLSVPVSLPLAEDQGPFAGPRDRPVDVRRALDLGLEIVAQLAFDFPHSVQLRHSPREPLDFELALDPYVKGHPPLPVQVRLGPAADDGGWTVTGTGVQGDSPGVDLAAFVALVNRSQAHLMESERRCGVLGIARGEASEVARALLVSVDAESIWAAEDGRVHVFSVDTEGAVSVVERSELPAIRPGDPAGNVREAVSTSGEPFRLFVPVRGEVFMANPPPRVLRYGGRAFVPVGGRLFD